MSKTLKIYQLQHSYTSFTPVYNFNGKSYTCPFVGGATNPIWKGGIFSTENENEQKAIENSKDFGDLIVCVYTNEAEKAPEPDAVIQQQEEEKALQNLPEETIKVAGVKNASEAKKWINANIEGVTHAMMPNKDAVLKIASEYNIEFVDWKQE